MKLKIIFISITAFSCFAFTGLKAQTDAVTYTPAHMHAGENFLIATGVNLQFGSLTDNMIATFGKQIPEDKRAAFGDVMKKFMAKYFNWDVLKIDLSKIYCAEFTEDELNQLTAFYNTPIGKKYGQKMPELTQKGIMLGQQVIGQHQGELQQMMQDALKNP